MLNSPVVRALLRAIIASAVMAPVISLAAGPTPAPAAALADGSEYRNQLDPEPGQSIAADDFPLPANLAAVEQHYELSDEAKQGLRERGLVVLPDHDVPLLSDAYFGLFPDDQVSVFITSDVAFHLFHNVFDGMLVEIERNSLLEDVTALATTTYSHTLAVESSASDDQLLTKAAARHNMIVFAVARRLLDDEFQFPPSIEAEAAEFYQKVMDHEVAEFYPGDDYTQFLPRGHYAGDEDLERYFRAMKWLSRRIYRIEDRHYPEESDVELVAASHLAEFLDTDQEARSTWDRVYDVTKLLVGPADSITPPMMMQALKATFGEEYDRAMLEEEENRALLRAELEKDEYPESEIISVPLQFPDQIPPKYVQFMGERFIADAHLMHKTTFPDVPTRLLPSGLDVMATVLGSERAEEWLASDMADHPPLAEVVAEQQEYFAGRTVAEWTKSTYDNWLYSLRPLAEEVPSTAPAFTQTDSWRDKQLNTAMGSWTQLRHDTILYGKQTMVPAPFAEGPGLVEPVPEAFDRLAVLSLLLYTEMDKCGVLPPAHGVALLDLYHHYYDWAQYAEKVADGEGLTQAEQGDVHRTGLWLLELFARPDGVVEKSPMLIADVASDSNTGRVLHEGTGHFKPLIVVYTPPQEKPIAGIGFAFSQYEFVEENWTRLTDEAWEQRLADDPPDDNPWVWSILPPVPGSDTFSAFLPVAWRAESE